MTTFTLILAFMLPLFVSPGVCSSSTPESHTVSSKDKKEIIVYYFHTSRRCPTCVSIERVAKNVVKEQYGKDKNVVFRAVNIEDKENDALAEKYEVGGSALLVCCGEKSKDLTGKAFQYGMSNPGKLQALIIETVDGMRKG
ncbi:MAG: thioredoxin family protein [Bacteroidetes bacterium]|nr:thioredoxin family protein [Bacteroidota bacterium]